MRYELNDLLDEDQVEELTAETFGGHGKKRVWKRTAALAACAALVVCAVNFEAIAAGVERLYQYISGVGAVEISADVAVQSGGAVSGDHEERTYVVDGAYAKNGVIYLPIDILSRHAELDASGNPASVDLRVALYRDGERVECGILAGEEAASLDRAVPVADGIWFPYEKEYDYINDKMWEIEGWGYLGEHYTPQGYLTGTYSVSTFRIPTGTNPAGTYTVRLTRLGSDLNLELPLTLEEPMQTGSHVDTRTIGPGVITAVVAPDGRGVSLFAQINETQLKAGERLVQLSLFQRDMETIPIKFLNADGESRPGQVRRAETGYFLTPEVVLMDDDFGPVTAVVIDSLTYNITMDGEFSQSYPEYKNLNWVIPIA